MRDGWSSSGKGWDDDAAPQQWMVVAGQPLATNLLDDVSGALQHGLIIFPTLPVRQLSRTFLPLLRRGRISDSEHYATLTLVGRPRIRADLAREKGVPPLSAGTPGNRAGGSRNR